MSTGRPNQRERRPSTSRRDTKRFCRVRDGGTTATRAAAEAAPESRHPPHERNGGRRRSAAPLPLGRAQLQVLPFFMVPPFGGREDGRDGGGRPASREFLNRLHGIKGLPLR